MNTFKVGDIILYKPSQEQLELWRHPFSEEGSHVPAIVTGYGPQGPNLRVFLDGVDRTPVVLDATDVEPLPDRVVNELCAVDETEHSAPDEALGFVVPDESPESE